MTIPAHFKEWFEREWNAYLDKPSVSKVIAMTWALKAWRSLSAELLDAAEVELYAERVAERIRDMAKE